MNFISLTISLVLVSVMSLSSVQCKDLPLTRFGKKVNSLLPKDTKDKTFNQNYKSLEELKKTEKTLPEEFDEAEGTAYDPRLIKEVNDASTRVLKTKKEGALFQSVTNAFSHFLKQEGKLNSSNVDLLAQMYVNELNKAAMAVPDEYSLNDTFTALVIANGKFLKSVGLTSQKDENQFIRDLTKAFNKTAMTVTGDQSIKDSHPDSLTEKLKLLISKDVATLQNDLSLIKILDSRLNIAIL